MLPKNSRISRKEIEVLLKSGRRYHSPNLQLYSLTKDIKNSKFSFSVSKKVCKNAVDRNKYRRRGYSVIGKHKSLIKSGFYCLFIFKKNSKSITFESIETEILELLSVSGVLI